VAAEAFIVFVCLIFADVVPEASVHDGLDDLLESAYAVHGCSPDVFELTLWGLPVKTLGCNLFVWGWGFLFRTVVRLRGNDGVFGFSGCFEAVPASTPSEHKRGDDVSEKRETRFWLRRSCAFRRPDYLFFGFADVLAFLGLLTGSQPPFFQQ